MRRPLVLTVLGILNLTLAVWTALGNLLAIVWLVLVRCGAQAGSAEAAGQPSVPLGVSALLLAASCIAAALLAAAGIGLLKQRLWGRTLSIVSAGVTVAVMLLAIAAQYHWKLAPQLELAERLAPIAPQAAKNFEREARAGMSRAVLPSLLGLIYPAVLLAFMYGPKLKAALRPSLGAVPLSPAPNSPRGSMGGVRGIARREEVSA